MRQQWMLKRQDYIEHQADRINVNLDCVCLIRPTFRGHIPNVLSTLEGVQTGALIYELGNTEVPDLELTALDQNVVRLNVAVDQFLVYCFGPLSNVDHHVDGSFERDLGSRTQHIRQAPTGNIFHNNVWADLR